MIEINNIDFNYGNKAIFKNFSLNILRGDRICLSGDSGIGKTTLLRLITGLEKPQAGSISITERARFSAVFQDDRLLPFASIIDNCTLIGASEESALKNLEALGIADYARSLPKELSGGMRRRAALARALSAEYDVLILDEPFTGLDSANIAAATAYVSEQLSDRTLIMVTHSPSEAEMLNAKTIRI